MVASDEVVVYELLEQVDNLNGDFPEEVRMTGRGDGVTQPMVVAPANSVGSRHAQRMAGSYSYDQPADHGCLQRIERSLSILHNDRARSTIAWPPT